MQVCVEAVYDALEITYQFEDIAAGVTEAEIEHFSYLACLLSVYKGEPPASWGYRFTSTSFASPYSISLRDAKSVLLSSGLISKGTEGLVLTEDGHRVRSEHSRLTRFYKRLEYLNAACGSAILMPLPIVSDSIRLEPELRGAIELSSKRELLGEGGSAALLDHFKLIEESLQGDENLLVPAVVWLEFMASKAL